MDAHNQMRSPLNIPQFQLSGSTPSLQTQDFNSHVSAGVPTHHSSNIDYLHQQQNTNTLTSSSPQVLKERIEEIGNLINKLHYLKASVSNVFSPLLGQDANITEVPPDFEFRVQRAQLDIVSFSESCQASSAFIQDAELQLNPIGSMFSAMKRRIPYQDEYPQRENSFGREKSLKKKRDGEDSFTSDLPRERLKAKGMRISQLIKNPPPEKLIPLTKLIDDWNVISFKEASPAGLFQSETGLSALFQTIELKVLNEFTAFILIENSEEKGIRRIHKVNFFSITEQAKNFEDSEHHVFKLLTNASIEQLPFPTNVPDTYAVFGGDPFPYFLDWIYSYKDIFNAPCSKCNKVMLFTPTSAAKFLPPTVRQYDRLTKKFIPLHTKCAQSMK